MALDNLVLRTECKSLEVGFIEHALLNDWPTAQNSCCFFCVLLSVHLLCGLHLHLLHDLHLH